MNEKNAWFKLGQSNRRFLYWYLGLLLMGSLGCCVYLVLELDLVVKRFNYGKSGLLACMSFCLLGCSIYYIRKLYKSCINLDIQSPITDEDKIRENGVLFYFLLRPIFSIGFGVLLFLTFKIGLNSVIQQYSLGDGFVYACMFFSFFIGYNAGDVVDHFEVIGTKIVTDVFKINKK
jgi:hypothetical protein